MGLPVPICPRLHRPHGWGLHNVGWWGLQDQGQEMCLGTCERPRWARVLGCGGHELALQEGCCVPGGLLGHAHVWVPVWSRGKPPLCWMMVHKVGEPRLVVHHLLLVFESMKHTQMALLRGVVGFVYDG